MPLRHYLFYMAVLIVPAGVVLAFAGAFWAASLCAGVALLLISSAAIMTPDPDNE